MNVNHPKHGYGITNDGNSTREFFGNYGTSVEIHRNQQKSDIWTKDNIIDSL